jgi:hypothetical protein
VGVIDAAVGLGASALASGASAVAASGDVGLTARAPGPKPMGGVGGATRGASR